VAVVISMIGYVFIRKC